MKSFPILLVDQRQVWCQERGPKLSSRTGAHRAPARLLSPGSDRGRDWILPVIQGNWLLIRKVNTHEDGVRGLSDLRPDHCPTGDHLAANIEVFKTRPWLLGDRPCGCFIPMTESINGLGEIYCLRSAPSICGGREILRGGPWVRTYHSSPDSPWLAFRERQSDERTRGAE